MALYSIADYTVEIHNRYSQLKWQCIDYIQNEKSPVDFTIQITEEELLQEHNASDVAYSAGYLESVCAYRNLCQQLPYREALLLHASVISCQGKGISFLARSGVGKTTHTMFWKKALSKEVEIINGDKPIIRFIDNIPYAYGAPWAGKENYQSNTRVPLTDICFLERSEDNATERISPEECVTAFLQQVLHCADPFAELKTLEMVDQLLSKCNLWSIRCNVSFEAAEIACNQIIGDVCNEIKI